jgi:hypothetical protein
MNEIVRLLQKGMQQRRLTAAAHEVGHGLAFLAAGSRPSHMRLEIGWFGGFKGVGVTQLRVAEEDIPKRRHPAYLVGVLAGHAAHARFLHRYMGVDLHRARDLALRSAGEDYERYFQLCALFDVRAQVNKTYAGAERFVFRHGTKLDKFTVRLAKSGRLSGGVL